MQEPLALRLKSELSYKVCKSNYKENLARIYDGNQLKNVTDATNYSEGFDDGNKHTQTGQNDYEYDAYGNMIKDRNKGITQITYNQLNLPKEIKFANNDKIEYLYTATGEKVRKKVTEGNQTQTIEYLEGFQYVDGELSFFPTAEGYVKVTLSRDNDLVFTYVYNYTDLPIIIGIGNIRLRYTRNPLNPSNIRILEEDHYYPFGMKHKGYNNEHNIIIPPHTPIPIHPTVIIPITPDLADDYKYKYNGKEFQDELGLNFYDYGARNYDPALGRWMNVDPLAEEYSSWSPYNYVLGNPMRLVDPDGNAPFDWRNKNGKLVYDAKKRVYTKYATAQDRKYGEMLRNSGTTGAKKFKQLVTGEHKTYVEFHSEKENFTLGHTESELNEAGDKLTKSKIDIYIGSVEEVKKAPTLLPNEEDAKIISENNLSVDDIVTAVFGHEIDHDTAPNKIQRDKEERNGGSNGKFNSELVPRWTQTKILQERANIKNKKNHDTGQ